MEEKWEYKIKSVQEELLEEILNELGNEGWELVAADFYVATSGSRVTIICKRKIVKEERRNK